MKSFRTVAALLLAVAVILIGTVLLFIVFSTAVAVNKYSIPSLYVVSPVIVITTSSVFVVSLAALVLVIGKALVKLIVLAFVCSLAKLILPTLIVFAPPVLV